MRKSAWLAEIQKQHKLELYVARMTARQETADFARIALNNAFGFGPERCHTFIDALNDVINDVGDMVDSDTRDKAYTVSKFEERLRQVDGKYYEEREKRHLI